MLRGIGDAHDPGVHDADEVEPLQSKLVDHGLEVRDERAEREVLHAVREAATSMLIAHKPAVAEEALVECPPFREVPLLEQM
jgi:hypothetical protein